jgi:hypothetical protein
MLYNTVFFLTFFKKTMHISIFGCNNTSFIVRKTRGRYRSSFFHKEAIQTLYIMAGGPKNSQGFSKSPGYFFDEYEPAVSKPNPPASDTAETNGSIE